MRSAVSARSRRLLALVAVALLALLVVVIVEDWAAGGVERERFQTRVAALDAALQAARASGYTDADLAAITQARQELNGNPEPVWVGRPAAFYRSQAVAADDLDLRLQRHKDGLVQQERTAADTQLKSASGQIAEDERAGADDKELADLRSRYEAVTKSLSAASSITELRKVRADAEGVARAAAESAAAQKQETAAIEQGKEALKQQLQGDVAKIREAGEGALTAGRNDATAATWLKVSGFDLAYRRLEEVSGGLANGDASASAFAAAGAQRYAGQIHDALIKGMPDKAILMSMTGQEVWGYEKGKVVVNTLVTSGRPELPTDVGPMKVLRKNSPWTFHSPWRPGSPYWYPDTPVQMVVWFTVTGEGFHDASWHYGPYGAGSEYGASASHGCVHTPLAALRFLYDWAEVGTPVILYPGDGKPLADQLKQQTTDANGLPLSGPKGA